MIMSNYCLFDQLPVELLHTLFTYFSASELFLTFYNINDYVNGTLQSYSSYQLDFKSISRSHFRRVCEHIRPEQVISLTLTDSNDTPGLSELFLSRFQMTQFTRLRSLTLTEIEFNSLESIFSNLSQLQQLRSFSFDACSIRYTYGSLDFRSHKQREQMDSMLRQTYTQIFPQLHFLHLNDGWALESISLPNLQHLRLGHCSFNELKTITNLEPKLRSLDVCVTSGQMNFQVPLLPIRLTRLNLKIQGPRVSMKDMESLLSNRVHLQHLELHVRDCNGLADGQRWQRLTNSLMTFHFKFHVRLLSPQNNLNSFRTSFWLEQKQWFVAYRGQCLFSVPYFAPEQVSTSDPPLIYSTAPDQSIFYKNVTQLIVNETENPTERFSHISILAREYPILREKLLRSLDLHYIKSLSILSLESLLQVTPLESNIPNVSQLSIKSQITTTNISRMRNHSYEQIRTLAIETNLKNEDHIIEALFRLFPHTKHLIYRSDIQPIALMIRFIDGFQHLLNASFISLDPLYNQDQKFRFNPDLMILKTKRLVHGTTMCRVYQLPTSASSYSIHWWIEE